MPRTPPKPPRRPTHDLWKTSRGQPRNSRGPPSYLYFRKYLNLPRTTPEPRRRPTEPQTRPTEQPLFPQMSDLAARVQRHEEGRRANSEDEKEAREIQEVTTRWLRNCARISEILTTKWLRKFARISEILTTKRLCAVSLILRGSTTGFLCGLWRKSEKTSSFSTIYRKAVGGTRVPNFSQ